ncbi:hypothetical protein AVEN_135496-1 [Araneus ventricosus]|uniref:Uncharacterized protein n=1 Tax=Araneus ventricosus TaxID=182803 RepID=A0A4Y2BCX0_ARAVE|nr:hypothetical protein AVEN_135496-1 [Araneus ventricosus]
MATANNLLKNSSEGKIFEIKKLIEIVAQELAFLASITDENNSSLHYSLKLSKFHMGSVKKQKLASCSYPSCLFNIRQKLWKNSQQVNQKSHKKTTTAKSVKVQQSNKNVYRQKQNRHLSRLTFQRRVNAMNNQSNQKVTTLVQKLQPKYPKPKRLIETATQTVPWTPESPPYSSSYQNSFRNISDNGEEEISDSEEELYCKSDTLNDASMITEEIASEFVHSRSKVDYKENASSSKTKDSMIMEDNISNRNYTSNSNYLGSNLKSEMVTQYSVKESVSASRGQNSVSKGRDTLTDQRSIRVKASKSINQSIRSTSEKINNRSNKLAENGNAVINSMSRSKSALSVRSNKQEVSVKSLSKASGNSKKSEKRSVPSSKRSSISKKNTPSSKKEISSKEFVGEVLDTAVPQDENEMKKVLEISKPQDESENHTEKEPAVEALETSEPQDEPENQMNQDSNISLKQKDEGNQNLDDSPPPVSSSDNETTYLPVVSNSSSASGHLEEDDSEGSSSIKENDDVSLEYSSHWTEEITSTEVSDAEMDESFNEKFLMYKEGLLEEDDGIVASSEDETPSTEEQQVTEILCNGDRAHKPLTEVICDGNMKNFLELVKNKENILQFVDENGWNLLHLAASKGLDDFIEELLHHGILIDSATKDGYTALHLAILNSDLECCKVLLRNGASLFLGDTEFDNEFLSKIYATAASPVKCLVKKYEENLEKVQKIAEVFNKFGSHKKNSSLVLPKNLLKTLADLILDDEDQETPSNTE